MAASVAIAVCGLQVATTRLAADEPLAADEHAPFEFTRMIAHWAGYASPDYLAFLDEARPELAQVGFHGAHFWSLAGTAHGGGYPAHLPLRGHVECGEWFERLNRAIQKKGIKVVGHFNVSFLVGDPDSPEGPRGFFKFYRDGWDTELLGPRPPVPATGLLERDREGAPISTATYSIGGMREYHACLRNPHWRAVLKAFVGVAIRRQVDGLIANYFYRHDCLCEHCVEGFRRYLGERFKPRELAELFAIDDLATHEFTSIPAWHDPATSTRYEREALRFSQITNQEAFDEVFVEHGRSLKPGLIVAQWNHLGDFAQINGDERCLLPADRWATHEDYTWYSTGDSANFTHLDEGILGEATLQARYIRGAMRDRPFTLGKYEGVRIRVSIAELAANGGAPMGFYTRFEDPEARALIARYYGFLHRHDRLFHASRAAGEVALLFPRSRVHEGDLEALDRFKTIGRALLDAHVLFDVVPDDLFTGDETGTRSPSSFAAVIDPADPRLTAALAMEGLPAKRSVFEAPATVRVSASRPALDPELTVHLVNHDREPRARTGSESHRVADEKPRATPVFSASLLIPAGHAVDRVEFLTPEADLPRPVEPSVEGEILRVEIPSFLVHGILRVRLRDRAAAPPRRRVAALVTEYRHNSHADVIVGRLLQTDTLDGQGRHSPLEVVSLYTDQRPKNDTSRALAASHGFRLSPTIKDALTLGTGELAVDGVLLIAEHGDYPRSATGSIQYPKRRFWEETLRVFRESDRAVPVFIDKHLADNLADARYIYDTAREVGAPLMAGSSLPVTWRRPAADVPRGAKLEEIVAISYHTTDAYGFHTLEFVQALAEQRLGGETGIRAVESIAGDAVWRAFDERKLDVALFEEAWSRLSQPQTSLETIRERVAAPSLFRLEYLDGLRVNVIELNGAASEWSAAWRLADGRTSSSLFWTQEGRPGMHFTYLLNGIEAMMETGRPSWNVERTLLTSGALDAMLLSRAQGGVRLETPQLTIRYEPIWRWHEPPSPPPMRPWSEQ